jgi:hypothetical protein
MTHTGQDRSQTLSSDTQQFLLWCLEAFGLHVVAQDAATYQLRLPGETDKPQPDESWPQVAGQTFSFAAAGDRRTKRVGEYVTIQSPLFCWLVQRLRHSPVPLSAAAVQQPVSVHELTGKLYEPYQVDGGHTSLAGCNLEDRPFLRLTYLNPTPDSPECQLKHVFADSDGHLLAGGLRDGLALHDLKPLHGRSPRLAPKVVDHWKQVTRQQYEHNEAAAGQLLATTLIWCKYMVAKLTFTIGKNSVELAAEGWARYFADQQLKPPPYSCPLTGKSSYHLAATDDGRISVAEAIAACDISGRRVLENELETCSVTGQQVLPEYLQVCSVSGQPVLRRALEACDMCHQEVSPLVLSGGRCRVCCRVEPISKEDPRLARLLGAYPQLDRWKSWRCAESHTHVVLVASSLLNQLLLVADKNTLEVTRLASGSRVRRRWHDADQAARTEWLGPA